MVVRDGSGSLGNDAVLSCRKLPYRRGTNMTIGIKWIQVLAHGYLYWWVGVKQMDGLAQDCSNSSALTVESLPSCTKPAHYNCSA